MFANTFESKIFYFFQKIFKPSRLFISSILDSIRSRNKSPSVSILRLATLLLKSRFSRLRDPRPESSINELYTLLASRCTRERLSRNYSGSFLTNYPLKALGGGRGRFHALVRIAVLTPLDRETRFKRYTSYTRLFYPLFGSV